ncbi:MAG: MarR family winged helix-turn-helix transcriptional regulator [Burkholderiaceae bacterium]
MPAAPNPQMCLKTIRQLAEALCEFEAFNRTFLRSYGLTPAQFDIIATLGNTDGMNFRELGEKTLITKGTLTGVIDRLTVMKLVRRVAGQTDRRTLRVELTSKGIALFEQAHPAILSELQAMMHASGYTERDFKALSKDFVRMRDAFRHWHPPARAA